MSSEVYAFCRAPALVMIALYTSGGYAFVPRNIMCSKKCAKPDLPGSTSLRDPVCIGICTETMLGKPVGTTMTLRPLGSVFSLALNGRMSPVVCAPSDIGSRMAQSAAITSLDRNIVLLLVNGYGVRSGISTLDCFFVRDLDRTFPEVLTDDQIEKHLPDAVSSLFAVNAADIGRFQFDAGHGFEVLAEDHGPGAEGNDEDQQQDRRETDRQDAGHVLERFHSDPAESYHGGRAVTQSRTRSPAPNV